MLFKAHTARKFHDDGIVAQGQKHVAEKSLGKFKIIQVRQTEMEAAEGTGGLIVAGEKRDALGIQRLTQGVCTVKKRNALGGGNGQNAVLIVGVAAGSRLCGGGACGIRAEILTVFDVDVFATLQTIFTLGGIYFLRKSNETKGKQ